MDRYTITLTGVTPMLMHQDNLEWDGKLKRWMLDPENKKQSVAGDDRSPAHRWIGYLYTHNGNVVVSSDNLMTAFREGGAKVPTGKGQKTFKSLTQCGILVDQAQWDLYNPTTGQVYALDGLDALEKEHDFAVHEQYAIDHGFELFAKRAKVGNAKHVRVRPRFDNWACTGTVTIIEQQITRDVLGMIMDYAGTYSGLCDWRPSSPRSPGVFGRFTATVKKL